MTTTTPQLPTKQTALEFHAGPDPLSSLRINHGAPLPTFPKSGSNTLVHVHYASPNPIDYKLAAVFWPVPRLVFGSGPIIPGTSFAGTVVQTTVPDLKAGDLVWGKHDVPKKFGGSAEYTVTGGVDGAIKVPDAAGKDLLDEFAGAGVVAITALQMLWASNLPYSRAYKASGGQATVQATGGTVFINGGSGGVGTFAVQMAKHCFGCEKVVASCSGANVDLVKSLGADEVVDYRSCGPGGVSGWLKDWSKRNGGQMFDVVLDNVGSDELYWQCHNYLKAEGGKYVQCGGGLSLGDFGSLGKKMIWPSILGGGKRPYQFLGVENKKKDFELIGQWMASRKIRCVIEDENRFDLVDGVKAYTKLNTGRIRGKIVLKVSDP